jgi:transposase InsO family protein
VGSSGRRGQDQRVFSATGTGGDPASDSLSYSRLHTGNGSEYIHYELAKMLRGLLIEFTKSRANRTQDNALVEGKNGAIIRKHMGYGHIGSQHAEAVHKFYAAHLNP